MVGHEKHATRNYLAKRGVAIARKGAVGQLAKISNLRVKDGYLAKDWRVFVYRNKLMAQIKTKVPELEFVDMPKYLDGYLVHSRSKTDKNLKNDFEKIENDKKSELII